MMSVREIIVDLNNIIDEKFKICKSDNGILKFIEKNKNARSNYVELKTQGLYVAFSLDQDEKQGFKVYPFFKTGTDKINSKNDGIIIFEKNNKLCIFLLEIKSDLSPNTKKKALSQLRKAKIFIDFLLETYKHYKDKETLQIDYIIKEGIFYYDSRKSSFKRVSSRRNNRDSISGIEYITKKSNNVYILQEIFD